MKKKYLIITGIMVLFIALGIFWGYKHYFTPDTEVQQQLSNQFGEDFFNSFDDEKANNNVETSHEKLPDPIIVTVPEKVNEQEGGQTPSTPVPEAKVSEPITQDQIINKYKPQFTHLQNVAMSRLDTLYSTAIQEYIQASQAGTLNRSKLIQKYIQAGTMLEANVDSQFYTVLNAMEAELVANNFSSDLVEVTKSGYEKAKSDKKSQLLAKIRK